MHCSCLIADDTEIELQLLRRVCNRVAPKSAVRCARNGLEAKQYLVTAVDGSRGRPLPNLILSDLHMPILSGLDLLKWVRGQPFLSHLPFVLLSNHECEQERRAAAAFGADEYLVKPARFNDLVDLLEGFWTRRLNNVTQRISETEERLRRQRQVLKRLSARCLALPVHHATVAIMEESLEALRERRDVLKGWRILKES